MATFNLKVNSDGTLDSRFPDGDKPSGGSGRVITGTDFGPAPNVVFFERFNGASGADVSLTPQIGSAMIVYDNEVAQAPQYFASGGRSYYAARAPQNYQTETARRKQTLQISFAATQYFRAARRTHVPAGVKFPGAASPGVVPALSSWKPCWTGTEPTFSAPNTDIVIGSHVGSGSCRVTGNHTDPRNSSNGTIQGVSFQATGDHFLTYYQGGDETSPGANDAVIDYTSANGVGAQDTATTGDPYNPLGGEQTNKDYQVCLVGPWFAADASDFSNVLPLEADYYLAQDVVPGDGRGRACILLSNAATIAASTEMYIVPQATWSSTQIETIELTAYEDAMLYTHIIKADGTRIENAGGV